MSDAEMRSRHAVAVIGGATAGAEATRIFTDADITTVVFEQNARPYGKVEDGLPRWHVKLRRKEYQAIDSKLGGTGVHFVPNTKIGHDVQLSELLDDWGFQAVVLANGAWRDRPLPIDGIDAYVDKGLIYQNALIHWFNHNQEAHYPGTGYTIADGAIIVGGGLASIDVAKVVQFELTIEALSKRGIEVDIVELEQHGIPKLLETHSLRWKDLGIHGCTLYYRRRIEDMPVVAMRDGADPAKIEATRRKLVDKARTEFLFHVEPLHAPVEMIVEGDRLAGLVFARTQRVDGRLEMTDETVTVRAPQIISSIGSVPEPIPGIEMNGELYNFSDWDLGRFEGHPNLFSVGNVVTGKGNLVASRKHAAQVASHMAETFDGIAAEVKARQGLSEPTFLALLGRVREAQERAGYSGDYRKWIESVTPPDFV